MSKSIGLVNSIGIAFSSIRMLTGAFSIFYLVSKGISIEQIGWLKAFQGFVLVFIDIPLSHIADQYSRKFSISISILTAGIWLVLMGAGSSFEIFLLAELFNAISLGLMSGTFNSYLYDTSKKYHQNKLAIDIFSSYQKYSFLVMGVVSILGTIIYSQNSINIWYLSGGLMLLTFLTSFYLPSDTSEQKVKQPFVNVLTDIMNFFSVNKGFSTHFIYANLFIMSLGQILIQYWQILIPNTYINYMLAVGVIFFIILNIQALSAFLLGRVKEQESINKILFLSVFFSLIALVLSYFSTFFIIISIFLLFFIFGILSSISLSNIVENFPKERHSTLLSTLAVFSKICMFILMPLSAILIKYLSFNFLFIIICCFSYVTYSLFKKNSRMLNLDPRAD